MSLRRGFEKPPIGRVLIVAVVLSWVADGVIGSFLEQACVTSNAIWTAVDFVLPAGLGIATLLVAFLRHGRRMSS